MDATVAARIKMYILILEDVPEGFAILAAAHASLAAYRNEIEDSTDFFQSGAYTAANPPPNWPFA